MVKSTVRFPEPVVEEIESLVEEGQFESKSEFYRFSADYVLSRTLDEYEPETIDYEAIEAEVIPQTERELGGDGDDDGPPFFDSVAFVRKLALRGRFSDAEDFIDHQYVPGDRHAVLLEEVLRLYRADAAAKEQSPTPEPDPETTTRNR
ncbi:MULTISPECIES: CopG family transcriptional regulator [Halorubrum]|uniref:CopG/Arc/MetJ family transcriptional regulator n=1 Tax=Halorubrum hochstenium ATCC 700873 TaxID=1227481 RepID=M0FCT4_9EURY|nr:MULTISPECIES: CopG family transcriptional regulator [Halorubrum]ELZ56434.1 CopG/Arc/MetJ family transcriptional regulator [Halorubrum hochstenium ATCC 700873]